MEYKGTVGERAKVIVEKLWGSKSPIGLNEKERDILESLTIQYMGFDNFDGIPCVKNVEEESQRLADKNIIEYYHPPKKLYRRIRFTDLEQQEVENAIDVEGMAKGGQVKNWITANSDKVAYQKLKTPDGRIWTNHSEYKTREEAEAKRDTLRSGFYEDANILDIFDGTNRKLYIYVTGKDESFVDNEPVHVITVIENGKPVTLNNFSEKERDESFEEIKQRGLKIISVKSVPFQEWKSKNKMEKGGNSGAPIEAERRQMNSLIAEYMGAKKTHSLYYVPEHGELRGGLADLRDEHETFDTVEHFRDHELKYDSSWDWLMPVVKKIILSGHHWTLHYIKSKNIWVSRISKSVDWSTVLKDEKGFSGGVKLSKEKGELFECKNESDIIAVWYVVAEFVKWHHNNKMAKGGNVSVGSMTLLEDTPVNINFSKGTFSEEGLSKEQIKFLKHIENLWLEDKLNQKSRITALEKYKNSGRGEEILEALNYWDSLNKPLDKKSAFHPSYLSDYLVGGGDYYLQINVGGEFNSRNVKITPKLERILKETTLLYALTPKKYYFKISQRGDLYIVYQQIIGDRMIASNVITDFEKGGDTSSKAHSDINWLITG